MRLPWQKPERDDEDKLLGEKALWEAFAAQVEINRLMAARLDLLELMMLHSTEVYKHVDQRIRH